MKKVAEYVSYFVTIVVAVTSLVTVLGSWADPCGPWGGFRSWLAHAIEPPICIKVTEPGQGGKVHGEKMDVVGTCNARDRCGWIYIFVRKSPEQRWWCSDMQPVQGSGKWSGLAEWGHCPPGTNIDIVVRGSCGTGMYRVRPVPDESLGVPPPHGIPAQEDIKVVKSN